MIVYYEGCNIIKANIFLNILFYFELTLFVKIKAFESAYSQKIDQLPFSFSPVGPCFSTYFSSSVFSPHPASSKNI